MSSIVPTVCSENIVIRCDFRLIIFMIVFLIVEWHVTRISSYVKQEGVQDMS